MTLGRSARGTGSKFWRVVQVASGNFLEMYDFMVFGYYAEAIGTTFFPGGSDFASLMKSLMTFGAGFLMRPLGALVLGAYMDRHGRRAGLLLTLLLMSIGTLSVACLPGYAVIGVFAPIIILLGRLVEGFSAGVELGGVSIYLAEIAPAGRKGFYVSWQSGSQQVAVMTAAFIGLMLARSLSAEQMTRWGWRVPLLVGCAIVPFLFFMRRSLTETEEFLAQRDHPSLRKVLRSIRDNWYVVGCGVMLATMTTVSFYMITAYTPTFGGSVLHLARRDNLAVTLCVGASNLIWLPVMGAVSDKIGRVPLLVASTLLAMASAYPVLFWLAGGPSFARLLTVELWLSFLYSTYNGAMVVYLAEVMPREVRTAGFSLAYSLATAIFGGFTPAIATFLIHWSGNRAIPGIWLAAAAVSGLAGTLLLRHRQANAT